MTLGPYPAVSLADARELAKAAFHLVAAGRDPATEKHTNREAPTFAELAQEYMELHAKVRKRERCWREDQRLTAGLMNDEQPAMAHSPSVGTEHSAAQP